MQWDYIHGLVEFAIYGGRVDNIFDIRVMVSYLSQLFDSSIISEGRGTKKLGPLKLPASTSHRVSIYMYIYAPYMGALSNCLLPQAIGLVYIYAPYMGDFSNSLLPQAIGLIYTCIYMLSIWGTSQTACFH